MTGAAAESYPLPSDPWLAAAARALRDARHWGFVVDRAWRLVYATDDIRWSVGGSDPAEFLIGEGFFGVDSVTANYGRRFGITTPEYLRIWFRALGPYALADFGDRAMLRSAVHPDLHGLVDDLVPSHHAISTFDGPGEGLQGKRLEQSVLVVRLYDDSGRVVGTVFTLQPNVGMRALAMMTSDSDPGHLERMAMVAAARRRPTAILFSDLERSSDLARRLSTAAYFGLVRRLIRAADECIVDGGGVVGRHVGDGVVAFFMAETAGSESAASRACITAVRALRAEVAEAARRSDLAPEEVVLRFGLHWGGTLYVGGIRTKGRAEVTALGDEVNEAARIEACATGGRALASKHLIERLDPADAAALDLDPDGLTYTALRDLSTATDKARRDAPAIAVTDI